MRVNQKIKNVILAAYTAMLIGTALELALLNHFEDTLQLIPVIGVGVCLVLLVFTALTKLGIFIRINSIILPVIALIGVYGVYLHFGVNMEFEQEMRPNADYMHWVKSSFTGAIPVLAPASLIVLSLLGYAYLLIIKHKNE